jgi:elongation factor P hydroxylase
MKKKSTSKSAFFNLRVLIGVVVVLAGILLALLGFGTFSNASTQPNLGSTSLPGEAEEAIGERAGQMRVIPALHSDLSRPLREQPVEWPQVREEREPHVHPKIPIKHQDAADPVIQSSFWQSLTKTPTVPAPIRQWAGIGKPCNGCGTVPPDTTGAAGKTQYVELVNKALQVFDKLTGTSLFGPVPIASVWSGFGGACETRGNGDPVVVYDRLADRWVISQFAKPIGVNFEQDECIAVSQTGDVTGPWYRYAFHLTSQFQDYPKFGVWPDGYYMSTFLFRAEPEGPFLGPKPFVFDRAKMLVGDPTATVQTPGIVEGPTEQTFLPSDLDGIIPPPLGDPNHFVSFPQEEPDPPPREAQTASATAMSTPTPTATPALIYKVWAFHVDWGNPGNSSFTLQTRVPAAGFTQLCTDSNRCVPQSGTVVRQWLDGLGDRLMFRNAYRRFPDGHESLLNNFTVDANSVAGIRWFNLQRALPDNWTVHQESTYRPDNTWRWMGSIASDNQGNIALGFSASSKTIYPQIRYAGRLATDPVDILSGEQHLFDGTGSQSADSPDNRWGDYSDMTVDPVDDCTFYYTTEYYQVTGEENWRTRIGYFRFAQCTAPQKGTARFIVCDRGAPLSKALVSIDGMTYGATLADGTYAPVLPPGSHTYAVSNPAFATQTGNFTIANGQTTLVEVCLGGRATVNDFNGDGHPDYVLRDTNTRQTAIWYLNNSVFIGSAYGPMLPVGWSLRGAADFNVDSHPDYALFRPSNDRTAIWYLNNNVLINAMYGPTLPADWELVATAGFNGDTSPDYVLYNMNNRETAIWYLNNNVLVNAMYGPTLPAGWSFVGVADFNGDGHPDYLLFNESTGQTAIWYLNNNVLVNAAFGPTLQADWAVVAAADFNGDGNPDYVLYNRSTRQTAIWYLNNNVFVNAAYGPILSGPWSLVAP